MRRISLLALIFLLLLVPHAGARERSATEAEVLRDFEQILDLWRDGKYAELYQRTDVTGKKGKEQFAAALAAAPRKPACCWEKMQDVRVSLKSERAAVVRAKLGFEGSLPGTEYVTKGIKLKKEDGVWIISQAQLLSLANVSKKRARYRYLPAK